MAASANDEPEAAVLLVEGHLDDLGPLLGGGRGGGEAVPHLKLNLRFIIG